MRVTRSATFMIIVCLSALLLAATGCQDSNTVSSSDEWSGQTTMDPTTLGKRGPSIPANLQVPAGNRLYAHVFARGVQIYQCTQTATGFAWTFVAPEANLFANECSHGRIGTHYAGPTWESNSGSAVVGTVLERSDSPDPNAIPWLLLQTVSTRGHGLFERTTFIQRLNTSGGKAPLTGADAEHLGQFVRVPYTAEYYFYQRSN